MSIKALYTSYDGRISRSKYWFGFVAVVVCVNLMNYLLDLFGLWGDSSEVSLLALLLMLLFLPLVFALSIKRFHDMGFSGWFSVLLVVPFLNLAVSLFWLGFVKGTDGDNNYGPDPLLLADDIAAEQ